MSYPDNVELPRVCVCYLVHGDRVLLGEKKTGLGAGKIVGPGGKLEPGETSLDAVVREVWEEIGVRVDPKSLRHAGEIEYLFPHRPSWSQRSSVYVSEKWSGEPRETIELNPVWFMISEIPFDRMWDDARMWLPDVLAGKQVTRKFEFGTDNDTVSL
jgi:8-oxo-dGTP diphosphatase